MVVRVPLSVVVVVLTSLFVINAFAMLEYDQVAQGHLSQTQMHFFNCLSENLKGESDNDDFQSIDLERDQDEIYKELFTSRCPTQSINYIQAMNITEKLGNPYMIVRDEIYEAIEDAIAEASDN